MKYEGTIVALSGPPWVITKTAPKPMRITSTSWMTTRKNVVGYISGQMMYRTFWYLFAPSIAADSMTDEGRPARAAM